MLLRNKVRGQLESVNGLAELHMANQQEFRRREHVEEESPGAGCETSLETDVPVNGARRGLEEILANSDSDSVCLEKLARAQQLAADPNYPPPEVIKSVAELLAKHLRPDHED
jgi:hypothetical protein